MSARSSRLHALERGLKAPRRSRAKARALTVMRFEGTATAAQPSITRPARLPKDMEDQINVVRGKTAAKPSRGLLQLEERLLRSRDDGPTPAAIQRHEHGATPMSAARALPARALSAQVASNDFSGPYNVESFEDTSASVQPAIIRTAAPVIVPKPASGVFPPAEPYKEISAGTVPPASDPKRSTRQVALSPDQKAVADNFERDIAAMLGTPAANAPEDQQWNKAVGDATTSAAVASAPATPVTAQPTQTPRHNAHDVFNQMGLAMNYANSFDLGAMDLSARLDRFDEELALRPKPASTTSAAIPVQAFALDDFDLVEDLAHIAGTQPAPIVTAATPASETTVTKEEKPAAAPPAANCDLTAP